MSNDTDRILLIDWLCLLFLWPWETDDDVIQDFLWMDCCAKTADKVGHFEFVGEVNFSVSSCLLEK